MEWRRYIIRLISVFSHHTDIVFQLRESNNVRVVDESNAFIPIVVTVSNEVELASNISLVLTPMIAPEDFRPLPTTRPFARANTSKLNVSVIIYIITLTIVPGRIDFFTEPIALNFMTGGLILLAGDVRINDDLIDEALEYFVVTLTFQDPDNVSPFTSIKSNGIRIDIVDNDGELKHIM